MNLDSIRRLLEPLRLRILNLVARGVVKLVTDTTREQELQLELLVGELLDKVEHPQPYGFTAHPHPGAEAYVVFHGGNRAHGLVFCVGDRRYRLTGLVEGEVALYDDQGQVVHIKRDRIEVTSPTQVLITAPLTKIDGDAQVTGDLLVDGIATATTELRSPNNVIAGFGSGLELAMYTVRNVHNIHVHSENDNGPAPTDPPTVPM